MCVRAFVCKCIGMFARQCARNLIPGLVLKPNGWKCNEHLQGARSGWQFGTREDWGKNYSDSHSIGTVTSVHRCTELLIATGRWKIFSISSWLKCHQTCHPFLRAWQDGKSVWLPQASTRNEHEHCPVFVCCRSRFLEGDTTHFSISSHWWWLFLSGTNLCSTPSVSLYVCKH